MSKLIKLTPECLSECLEDFQNQLKSGKFTDGRVSYSKTLGCVDRKATLYFTEIAYLKMQTLIREFEKEVAWHGVAKRGEDGSKDEYYITDILVYPQTVTGSSVDMNVEKYDKWLRDNYDDERFSSIGMQGHSHVNMGTSPSPVDLEHQREILSQITDDMFYIFVIWNKRGDKNIKIYDLAKNILFETSDVTVEVLGDFLADAKEMVAEEKKSSYSTVTYQIPTATKEPEKKDKKKKKGKMKKSNGGFSSYSNYDMGFYPYNDPFYYE